MKKVDAIVIGCGGVGSAALHHLAKRGVSALALDRFPPAHDRGSSHGETRIIRQAYYEHPDYVPLCRMAYEMWDELSAECGRTLRHETGLLQVGPEDGPVVSGVLESAQTHGLDVERLSGDEVMSRFPGFVVPEGMCGVFEMRAGYLEVENCIRAHVDRAEKLGAEVVSGLTVRSWRSEDSGLVVETDGESFGCDHLIVTAGAWASHLLTGLGVDFEVRRKPLLWFESDSKTYRADEGCPAFLFEGPEGVFYGIPDTGGGLLKVAEHSGGAVVADPLEVDRELHEDDRGRIETFLSSHLPGVSSRIAKHTICMYTMTADEHFVVDVHPKDPRIVFAAGLSGHGFKMAGVLGKALADMAIDAGTSLPVGFLGCRRPSLAAS